MHIVKNITTAIPMSSEKRRLAEDLHLPPNTPEHEHAGLSTLLETVHGAYHRLVTAAPTSSEDNLDTAPSPIVTFARLPPRDFQTYLGKFPGRADYLPKSKLLILTMLPEPHESASEKFKILFALKARERNVSRIIKAVGSKAAATEERTKQPDGS